MLLPDDWRSQKGKSLESIATYQYTSANRSIIESLQSIEEERKFLVNYSDLLKEPKAVIRSLLDFAELDNKAVDSVLQNGLAYSRYTLTKPRPNKWHQNAHEMAPYMHNTEQVLKQINALLLTNQLTPLSSDIDIEVAQSSNTAAAKITFPRVSRHSACPCGSAKKYRHCHGKLS